MNFVIVDIESTGLSFDKNEIIEIGAVRIKDGEIIAEYQQLVKPEGKISRLITSITGITNEAVEEAPSFKEIAPEFLEFLGDDIFVAHNVAFDFKMLNVILRRNHFSQMKNRTVDTQDLITLMRPDVHSHQLSELIQYFSVPVEVSHRALSDARATAMILILLLQEIESLPISLLFNIVQGLRGKDWPLTRYFEERLDSFSVNKKIASINWKDALTKQPFFVNNSEEENEIEEMVVPIDQKRLNDIFQKKIPDNIAGYEKREGQQLLSEKIAEAFNDNNILFAEAGTGIGKTMSYLVPSVMWLEKNKAARIMISTKTKNLQNQIVEKDIPLIKDLLNKDLKAIAVKGRENYICLTRYEELVAKKKSLQDTLRILGILVWLYRSRSGEIEELHPSIRNRYRINSEAYNCLKDNCPNKSICFLRNVRQNAKKADLLIVNHSLMLTDIIAESKILPFCEKLIIDEAHSLEDIATESFSIEVTFSKFIDVIKQYHKRRNPLKKELEEIFAYFEDYARPHSDLLLKEIPITEEFKLLLSQTEKKVEEIAERATPAVSKQLLSLWEALVQIVIQRDGYVSYVHFSRSKPPYNVVLRQFPLNIGELLKENLWAEKESVVLTSATLTINQNFKYIQQRLGIDEEVRPRVDEVIIISPYDHQNMYMAVPSDLKDISGDEYLDDVLEKLLYVLKIFKGRTLVLFTSYKMLDQAYEQLNLPASEMKISILKQKKNESRSSLISRIKKRNDVVIFGTDSFWEGVDIIGEALSCVVLMKLPFSVPTDPVNQARCELLDLEGLNSFINYIVPRAIIKFRQGIGRLIRSHHDRGAVLIFDNRLITKSYGKIFLKSLQNEQVNVLPFSEITRHLIQSGY